MRVITKPTVYFDVDDTLVMWNQSPSHPKAREIKIFGRTEILVVHEEHIKQMRDHKFRGHHVTVWSAGGWEWAQAVVEALELTDLVDDVMDKPHWFYDDLRSDQFMPETLRVYIETYKGRNKGHGGESHAPGTVYAVADADIKEGSPVVVQNGRAYPV